MFKLPFEELVNTQCSTNVSLYAHVVKTQYICSQRLATESKTKTVHKGEGNYPEMICLTLATSPFSGKSNV